MRCGTSTGKTRSPTTSVYVKALIFYFTIKRIGRTAPRSHWQSATIHRQEDDSFSSLTAQTRFAMETRCPASVPSPSFNPPVRAQWLRCAPAMEANLITLFHACTCTRTHARLAGFPFFFLGKPFREVRRWSATDPAASFVASRRRVPLCPLLCG